MDRQYWDRTIAIGIPKPQPSTHVHGSSFWTKLTVSPAKATPAAETTLEEAEEDEFLEDVTEDAEDRWVYNFDKSDVIRFAQCAEDTKQERSGIGGIFPETELNGRGRVQMRHPLRPTMNLQILPVQLMIFSRNGIGILGNNISCFLRVPIFSHFKGIHRT